jgi:hypothetical protein
MVKHLSMEWRSQCDRALTDGQEMIHGDLPAPWWTPEDDKHLLYGSYLYGFGHYEDILKMPYFANRVPASQNKERITVIHLH